MEGRDWPHSAHSRFVSCGALRWHVQVMGSGPAVLVMTEMPGISPQVARFARWVRDATIACTEDARLIQAAHELGEVIRKENGVSSAVHSIERFARSRGLT